MKSFVFTKHGRWRWMVTTTPKTMVRWSARSRDAECFTSGTYDKDHDDDLLGRSASAWLAAAGKDMERRRRHGSAAMMPLQNARGVNKSPCPESNCDGMENLNELLGTRLECFVDWIQIVWKS